MRITKTLVLLLPLLWVYPSFAAQRSAESMYQDARKSYYALLSSPSKMKQRSAWNKVIRKFKIIVSNRPSSSRADDALYTVGLLYKKLSERTGAKADRDNAVKYFSGVISRYPKSNLADDAQRQIGDIRFEQRDTKRAKRAYRKTSRRKPSSSRKAGGSVATLTGLKRFSRDGYTRLILYLSNQTAYTVEKLKDPDRVFIDLLDTRAGRSIPKVKKYGDGMARAFRVAQNNSKVARVVLDLREKNTVYTVSSLRDPFRIVVDLGRSRRASAKATAPPRSARKAPPRAAARAGGGKIRTIVIDPGHGGKDPGAIGPSGLREKNVTLAIARKLKKSLAKKCGCRVELTRNSDRYLELDERTVIANSLNADLFISIHVNASRNRSARGMETYFLSPARSKDELETAARENMLALKSSNEVENDLAYIMSDLSNTRKVNDSVTLAKSVQRSMVRTMRRGYAGVRDKGVKQAVFYVLWRASMPSVLVETGFITNRTEERRLRDSRYISRLAESIAGGVMKYSKTYMVASNAG